MGGSREAAAFDVLAGELIEVFARGVEHPLDEETFDQLAHRVFAHQFARNPVYRRFCEARGATPDTVDGWRGVPAVPTAAFKRLRLLSADPARVERVFRTSGTSGGGGAPVGDAAGGSRRGEHHVPSLALYRAAALPNFRAHLLPDLSPGEAGGGVPLPAFCLMPSPSAAPDSSLSTMMGMVVEEVGARTDRDPWYVHPRSGLDAARLMRDLERAADAATTATDVGPLLLAGTAFAWVHFLDAAEAEGWRVELPEGSRLMETGGFKGRSRIVPRDSLYAALEARLGIPPGRMVNEYGMTELLSQFYEPVLRAGGGEGHRARVSGIRADGEGQAARPSESLAERHHVGPPWVRTVVLDPRTLEPLAPGERGLLCHLDLANVGSVARILTEDVGYAVDGGFRVLGRAEGAEPRGCSRAVDELLAAAG